MYEKIKLFKKGVADLIFIETPCEYFLRRVVLLEQLPLDHSNMILI